MTMLGNPTRKRGIRRIFLAYASGYHVSKQHHFVLAALVTSNHRVVDKKDGMRADAED